MSGMTFVDVTPEPEDATPEQVLPTVTEWPSDSPPPPTVSIASHPCVTVSCSKCERSYDGDDVTLHFDTVAEALARAFDSEWVLLVDGTLLCESCADDERCRRFGHPNIRTVEEWTTAAGHIHPAYSYCERCSVRTTRDGAPLVTDGEVPA